MDKCGPAMPNHYEKLGKQVKRASKQFVGRLEAARKGERREGEKKLWLWIAPPKSAFNGDNLHRVFHHFKVWLHEVCRSGLVRYKWER